MSHDGTDLHSSLKDAHQMVNNLTLNRKAFAEGKKEVTAVSISNSSVVSSTDSAMFEDRESAQTETVSERSRSAPGDRTRFMNPILYQLEQLIVSDEWIGHDNSPSYTAPPRKLSAARSLSTSSTTTASPRLNELGRTLVTTASLKCYIDLLGQHHRQSVAAWLSGNASVSLSQMCRFPSGQLFCHPSEHSLFASFRPGIGHAIRLALRERYGNRYAVKGWRVFAEEGAPVIYVTPSLHIDILSYVAAEFGISDVVVLDAQDDPLSCVEGRIDYEKFALRIDDDLKQGKKPLLLIGVVGSAILGHNDMISKLLEIRNSTAPFWIHVVGNAVAALALKEPNETLVQVLSQVDSITFPLAKWLGIPSAPIFTLYRPVDLYKPSYHEKLESLPWWVTTQYLTSNYITEMLEHAYFLSKIMLKGLSSFKDIRIIGFDNPIEYADRVYKGIYTAPTVITFKCFHDITHEDNHVDDVNRDLVTESQSDGELIERAEEAVESDSTQAEPNSRPDLDLLDDYVDSLNSWLGQGLLSECRQLGLQLIDLGAPFGLAFRFCPLENAASCTTKATHVQQFIKHLEQSMKIIDSTVNAKKQFVEIVSKFPGLRPMKVSKWAGVGAVCYVPSILKGAEPHTWNDKQKQQVSHLNLEVVHSLRSTDSAFSTGECEDLGVSCIKFGMLSDEKDLKDLAGLVAERGKSIEESQQYMDSLAELIRQGIQAANEDLKRETNMRLQQEGVMRQLPMVGSLYNWFLPLDKEAQNIRGRSFDLNTGLIQSTDSFYKHTQGDSRNSSLPLETPQQIPHGNANTGNVEEEGNIEDVREHETK